MTFLPHEVESDDPRSPAGFEVAAYRIPNLLAQVGDAVSLREGGLAERPRGEASFGCFLDQEDQLRFTATLVRYGHRVASMALFAPGGSEYSSSAFDLRHEYSRLKLFGNPFVTVEHYLHAERR